MPTILGLSGIKIPKTVEGLDYSGYMRGGKNPSDGAALISCVTPFGEWEAREGGKEFRGIRTERYTYVRDLNGPWLLFDNDKDPLQLKNLVGAPEQKKLQQKLDAQLQRKLRDAHDDFLPGAAYVKKWGYVTTERGTIPYEK
jgi:arylsulfatase A-like enzyme